MKKIRTSMMLDTANLLYLKERQKNNGFSISMIVNCIINIYREKNAKPLRRGDILK
jgi:hypothetical protein